MPKSKYRDVYGPDRRLPVLFENDFIQVRQRKPSHSGRVPGDWVVLKKNPDNTLEPFVMRCAICDDFRSDPTHTLISYFMNTKPYIWEEVFGNNENS